MRKRAQSWRIGRWLMPIIIAMAILTGCSGRSGAGIQRIALLAPFEGRNSEIGYDAYYAVRLAMKDHGSDSVELLAIDDGGSATSASERAKALARDPLVKVVIALGNNATDVNMQADYGTLPVIIVGQWNTKPTRANIYMLANITLERVLTSTHHDSTVTLAAGTKEDVVGGEIFALTQFPLLNPHPDNVVIASSASLPDEVFRQRYLNSGQYVPEPGLLATLSYDAAGIALDSLGSEDVNKRISTSHYSGLNGDIHFVDGYWENAPIHYFQYDANGKLTPVDRPIK